MASITSLGVGSGIDAESIVTKLMTLERQPLNQITTKETAVNAKISAFGTLKSLLATLRTATDTLGTPNKLAAFTGTSSNESALTATASTNAPPKWSNSPKARLPDSASCSNGSGAR